MFVVKVLILFCKLVLTVFRFVVKVLILFCKLVLTVFTFVTKVLTSILITPLFVVNLTGEIPERELTFKVTPLLISNVLVPTKDVPLPNDCKLLIKAAPSKPMVVPCLATGTISVAAI